MKKNLIGLSKQELSQEIQNLGEKSFRTKQIWSWIYYFGVKSFDEMVNLSKNLKQKLKENYTIERPKIIKDLISKDQTRKWLIKFQDGKQVEMVYIPEEDRGTFCISSQIGCAMSCKFCNTGTQGLCRNMSTEEIVQQLMVGRDCLDEWKNISKGIGQGRKITNLVIMGMGEPLMNYENIIKALKIISDPDGIAFSKRRITLSTCGLAPKIKQLPKDIKVNLAISLHAATDEIRKKIMPIAQKYTIEDIMKACHHYSEQTGRRRITFEYIMIKGLNDNLENASKLIRLVRKHKIPAKFNLIPFNKWKGCEFEPPHMDHIKKFAKIITDAKYPCPIRKPRGQDIMAACGQLKSQNN